MNKLTSAALILFFMCLFAYGAPAQDVLTWQDCLVEAQKNNPELISALEVVNQDKASKSIAASSLYPQISVNLDASTAKTSSTNSSGVSTSATNDSYSYGVSGTQVIFNGLKNINDINAASQNVKVAQQAYRFSSSQVRLNLRFAFVNLLKVQELIKVAEEIVKIRRDNLVMITLQYQSGLEHKGALLTSEANLDEANFELAQAKRNVEFYQRQLTKEMGRKEFKPLSVQGEFIVSDSAKEKPNFEDLVKDNPSVLEAVFKKNAALFGIRSAYGNFLPQLSANAGAERKSAHWPPENDQWNLGLGVTMPIFEGGLKFAQASQAQSLYRQAQADEITVRDTAIVSLEQTWAALQDAIETVDVKLKSLEAAQERSKIAEAQYSIGTINFNSWTIIEDGLVAAKKAYLQAQADALLAEANWIQAKGETLEYAKAK